MLVLKLFLKVNLGSPNPDTISKQIIFDTHFQSWQIHFQPYQHKRHSDTPLGQHVPV